MISAKLMIARTAQRKGYSIGSAKLTASGYEVHYGNGYVSWSPGDVFQSAYKELSAESVENPAHRELLAFFAFDHLPPHLQQVSAPFAALAYRIADSTNPREATVALRKLLESKDAAVRAAL